MKQRRKEEKERYWRRYRRIRNKKIGIGNDVRERKTKKRRRKMREG